MPIFEFECQNCGHKKEEIIMGGLAERVVGAECPKCGEFAKKVPISLSNIKVGGNFTAKNGYSIVKGDESNVKPNA